MVHQTNCFNFSVILSLIKEIKFNELNNWWISFHTQTPVLCVSRGGSEKVFLC